MYYLCTVFQKHPLAEVLKTENQRVFILICEV